MTPFQFYLAAAQWGDYDASGSPGACMYGFDERGCVQSEQHRQACLAYIDGDCRAAADLNIAAGDDPEGQHDELDALRDYLLTAPLCKDNQP